MNIKLISKYRSALMAIMMIWVAFYHSQFPIGNKLLSFILERCGYAGACGFLFLSAFGLYYAYKKENKYCLFIKKRFYRIIPYCFPMIFIYLIINQKGLVDAFFNAFGIYSIIGINLTNWFTSCILLLYSITPFYLNIFKKKPVFVFLFVLLLIIILSSFTSNEVYKYILQCLSFYPIGFLFAYLNDLKDIKINSLLVIICFIIGWFMMYYAYHHYQNDINHIYPLYLIIPSMCLLASQLIDKLSFIQKILTSLGKYTYQFYLLHEQIEKLLYNNYGLLYRPGIYFDWLINIAAFLIALLLAIVLKRIVDKLLLNSKEKIK